MGNNRRAMLTALLIAALAAPQAPARATGTWDADRFGNQRAVLRVAAPSAAVRARVEWRRRDADAAAKNLILVDARSGARVRNLLRLAVSPDRADLVFEPVSGAGDYYLYFLPNVGSGRSNYPRVVYPPPEDTADPAWVAAAGLDGGDRAARADALAPAEVVAIEAIDDFNRFDPMEVAATADEHRRLLERHPSASFLVFAEDRRNPIRMPDRLPLRWIEAGPGRPFRGEAVRGEFYAFQLGLYAVGDLRDVDVRFGPLSGPGGAVIPASAQRCFNLGGNDWQGQPFRRRLAVPRGTVQALWIGVAVPAEAAPGTYTGAVTVAAAGTPPSGIPLSLAVGAGRIEDSGDGEPWRHSRLRWLDSTLAADDEVVPPYRPIAVSDRDLSILGRRIRLAGTGFPERIDSSFTREMTGVDGPPRPVLAAPITLRVESAEPGFGPFTGTSLRFVSHAPGRVAWESAGASGSLAMTVRGQLEFDGTLEYQVELTAARDAVVSDIRLEIPLARDAATYMMGMGVKGGLRPAAYHWSWDVAHNQDSAWVGDVNAGLQLTLKDDRYSRPLNTNFYHQKPLVMPASWANGGKGGCRFSEIGGETVLVGCYSGPRVIRRGDRMRYDFRLMVTPFRPLDTRAQFSTRYLHAYEPIAEAAATGANTINVHHANAINPYINYPFLRPAEMKAYVDEAHARGLKVKIYYTVRELSNRAPELFALRSLGDEIFSDGPGGGFSWLQEHLGGRYIAAWFVPALKDAAIITAGISRWHNYYVEGLDYLARHVGIDGLYIDDVAFDRTTMKRVRKVLDRRRPGALIDLHSANQFNVGDGFASSANLYLEHFPYIDRLWFGEYFDYGSAPDYWLVELSGIPFGLMSEMLQDGGNPWRGMVFGMTGRLPWAGNPRPLWQAWDAFGMADSRMVGFWVEDRPVKTDRADVLATTYRRDGKAMVALASWSPTPAAVKLSIDWTALGIDPSRATIEAEAIAGFQEARTFTADESIPIEPGKGWLIVIR